MSEESRMDKKSQVRSTQPQSKASAIDCKKNTELSHKPWPRNNKKREGTGSTPKNEPYRKNVPTQRGRGQIDRRPRIRGNASFALGGTENTGLDPEDEPYIGSMVPERKKQNLNHLLNFMYPSRGGSERRDHVPRRHMFQRTLHRYEHDLYLRAYCQFVVREGEDYKINMLNPDIPVKWDLVEEIVVRSNGRSECPICLGSPVAARVGHCGHVYCWACILHYAAAHEKQPPPCPVCATTLKVKEMKPAKMIQWKSTEEVTMHLVRRLRGSTIVEMAPPRGNSAEPALKVPAYHDINNSPYAKLFTASKEQIQGILEREKQEIETQILNEIDTTEVLYLEEALQILKLKVKEINENSIVEKTVIDDISKPEPVPIIYENQVTHDKRLDWFDVSDEGVAGLEAIENKLEDLTVGVVSADLDPEASGFNQNNDPEEFPLIESSPSTETSKNIEHSNNISDVDKDNQAKYFYFYQADDGQQMFLNSLNVRILNASWGALVAAPSTISGRVLHRETISLCEQTRKHMPYTAHLPLHCAVDIVELDLEPPHVTDSALKSFADDLDRRARARARHERDERRRERAYRRAMEGPPRPDISSQLLFPPAAPSSPPDPVILPPDNHSPSTSGVMPPSTGMSFAKMASTSGTWRVRKTAPALPPTPPPVGDGDEEPESICRRTVSLSDAIEAALLATPTAPARATGGKKNKKSKQKLLFATGVHHAG